MSYGCSRYFPFPTSKNTGLEGPNQSWDSLEVMRGSTTTFFPDWKLARNSLTNMTYAQQMFLGGKYEVILCVFLPVLKIREDGEKSLWDKIGILMKSWDWALVVNKEALIMVLVLVIIISKTCYEANWALHSGPLGCCSSWSKALSNGILLAGSREYPSKK